MSERIIYTVGHSDHSIERFLTLLKQHGITAVADVRSAPYSRRHPQFNKDAIAASLKEEGVAYVFLGKELGARPNNPTCYEADLADFGLIARTEAFQGGIERVLKGSEEHHITLMCAEKEPLNCHRTLLICHRGLLNADSAHPKEPPLAVKHILYDGTLEDHCATEMRLLELTGCEKEELFMSDSERLELAYKKRGGEIAYRSEKPATSAP